MRVVIFQSQIMFSKDVSHCLRGDHAHKSLAKYREKNIHQLNQMARLVSTNLVAHKR